VTVSSMLDWRKAVVAAWLVSAGIFEHACLKKTPNIADSLRGGNGQRRITCTHGMYTKRS
jgi:hypothetical protein